MYAQIDIWSYKKGQNQKRAHKGKRKGREKNLKGGINRQENRRLLDMVWAHTQKLRKNPSMMNLRVTSLENQDKGERKGGGGITKKMALNWVEWKYRTQKNDASQMRQRHKAPVIIVLMTLTMMMMSGRLTAGSHLFNVSSLATVVLLEEFSYICHT